MKKIIAITVLFIGTLSVNAQNIGIGTTTPNIDALLDINSTTKGVLFPRMTTVQRISIPTPPNGLMVFDTDRNELYQYISATFSWRTLINDSYWRRQSLTRSRIGNSSDSVGIGTVSPTEWLDVNGNIRSRNDMLADGRVIATGTVTGSGLITPGGLTVSNNGLIGGNFTANGDLSTNNDLIVNNSSATVQLKDGSSVNKGFFQLSGNNVRMGTNSGNTTGNLIVRMNGTDRVTVDEVGNVNLSGELRRSSVTGTASLTPYCYGSVSTTGAVQHGTGNFSAQRLQQGYYRITCSGISFGNCVILVTSGIRSRLISTIMGTNEFDVVITNLADNEADADFDFVIFRM
jgi:hypothetical protein